MADPVPPIHLHGFTAETSLAQPTEVLSEDPPSDRVQDYVVQFAEALTRQQRQQLQVEIGLRLTDYIPKYAYLERLNSQQLQELLQSPLIHRVFPFQPAYRISPTIGQLAFQTPERRGMSGLLLRAILNPEADLNTTSMAIGRTGSSRIRVLDDRSAGGVARIEFVAPSHDVISEVAGLEAVRWVEEIPEIVEDDSRSAGAQGVPTIVAAWERSVPWTLGFARQCKA